MIEYIDVADLTPEEAHKKIIETQTRYDVVAHQMQKEMNRRHADHNKQKDHPTKTLNVHGQDVEIDVDMIPVIQWLNAIPGVFTTFCCQGDADEDNNGKHKKPYVLWYSQNQNVTIAIIKRFTDFHEHSATLNIRHTYHEIETKVDYLDGLRYSSHWYDNISLQDFIQWAAL